VYESVRLVNTKPRLKIRDSVNDAILASATDSLPHPSNQTTPQPENRHHSV